MLFCVVRAARTSIYLPRSSFLICFRQFGEWWLATQVFLDTIMKNQAGSLSLAHRAVVVVFGLKVSGCFAPADNRG
jgi:hypothetical protein